MTVTLVRLVPVPIREVWPHEANDFTPWLAEPDNISVRNLAKRRRPGLLNFSNDR